MIRKVITQSSRYKYFSITADESKFVVRVLCPSLMLENVTKHIEDLLSTTPLLGFTVGLENSVYDVVAEGIFDKTINTKQWKAGNTISFFVTPNSIARGTVEVVNLDGELAQYNETETEYHHRNGNCVIAKLYCADSSSSILEADKQILVDTTGFLFTNLDLSNSTDCDVFDYQFGLGISLYLPTEFKPNTEYTIKVSSAINTSKLNGCLYMDATGGILPNKMVKLVDGIGEFTFSTNGLKVGDVVDLSIGSRLNPYHLTATLNIVG